MRCGICLLIAADQTAMLSASLLLRGQPPRATYESSCDCTCNDDHDHHLTISTQSCANCRRQFPLAHCFHSQYPRQARCQVWADRCAGRLVHGPHGHCGGAGGAALARKGSCDPCRAGLEQAPGTPQAGCAAQTRMRMDRCFVPHYTARAALLCSVSKLSSQLSFLADLRKR